MITPAEIVHGLAGAARIVRFDVRVREWFDDSLVAARRSFWAAAIAFPFDLLIEMLPPRDASAPARELDLGLIVISYAIGWTAYPLAAWHLTRAFGFGAYYARYLTAYNWSNALQFALFAPIIALANLAGGDSQAAGIVGLGVIGLSAAYAVFVARVMLGAATGQALILVFVDLLISRSLGQLVEAIRLTPSP